MVAGEHWCILGQNIRTQHTHCFGCRQYENWHIVKPLSRQQFITTFADNWEVKMFDSRHIWTSRAQWHRPNNKIPTAVPLFSRSKFLMAPIPVGLSCDVDSTSARNPRWRSPKWKATLLGSSYFLSCHVISWPSSWIWSKRESILRPRKSWTEHEVNQITCCGDMASQNSRYNNWCIYDPHFGWRRGRRAMAVFPICSPVWPLRYLWSNHSTQFVIECLRRSNQQGECGSLWVKILWCSLWNRSVWCRGLQRANTPTN